MFTQPFIQTHIKENIKAPRHWPLCGEFTGTGEFPAQRASYAENVSIWWRHHGVQCQLQYLACIWILILHHSKATSDSTIWGLCIIKNYYTHWGRDKMTTVSLTTLSNAFSWMTLLEFRLRFHWSSFLRVQLTIFQHWFRWWLHDGADFAQMYHDFIYTEVCLTVLSSTVKFMEILY